MPREEIKDLRKFLKPFPEETKEIVFWLREFVWDLYPKTNELIYDNYNAVAFGWSPTDKVGHTFCSIAVGRTSHNIHFGFYWGSEIADPEKKLMGEGNQYRYILVKQKKGLSKDLYQKIIERSLCKFSGKSEGSKANKARRNNGKIHFRKEKRKVNVMMNVC